MGFDVNRLDDLSDEVLIAEARRRGVPAADVLGRERLIEILREPRDEGPLSRARALLGRVVGTVRAALPDRRSDRPPSRASETPPRTVASSRGPTAPSAVLGVLGDPTLIGVRVIEEPDGTAVVWRVAPDRLEAGRALLPEAGELRVRTVRVRWPEGAAAPVIERAEHGPFDREGAVAILRRLPGERIVVAIGLATGARFVSVDHATAG